MMAMIIILGDDDDDDLGDGGGTDKLACDSRNRCACELGLPN